jgi:hypothetical protein
MEGRVVYWEGSHGVVFRRSCPDAATWDRCSPDWLVGRHAEVRGETPERALGMKSASNTTTPRTPSPSKW